MTTELHEGPLEAAPAVATPAKLTWRQQRQVRRRRRVWFEEILGWILVPLIVIGSYWLIELVLNGLGTSTEAIINGISALKANLQRIDPKSGLCLTGTFEIEELATGCELTLTHEMNPEWTLCSERTQAGWGMILDGLTAVLDANSRR